MGALGSILNFIGQSERLIVVTVTISLAGIACYVGESYGAWTFAGLPVWGRPLALIVWILAVVHVLVRTSIGAVSTARRAGRHLRGWPERRQRAEYDQSIIDILLATTGVEREILSYVLYRRKNQLWSEDKPRWFKRLKSLGLIELYDAGWTHGYYRIHETAWKYMNKYPTKFRHVIAWEDAPWTAAFDEKDMRQRILAAQKEKT